MVDPGEMVSPGAMCSQNWDFSSYVASDNHKPLFYSSVIPHYSSTIFHFTTTLGPNFLLYQIALSGRDVTILPTF